MIRTSGSILRRGLGLVIKLKIHIHLMQKGSREWFWVPRAFGRRGRSGHHGLTHTGCRIWGLGHHRRMYRVTVRVVFAQKSVGLKLS